MVTNERHYYFLIFSRWGNDLFHDSSILTDCAAPRRARPQQPKRLNLLSTPSISEFRPTRKKVPSVRSPHSVSICIRVSGSRLFASFGAFVRPSRSYPLRISSPSFLLRPQLFLPTSFPLLPFPAQIFCVRISHPPPRRTSSSLEAFAFA